MLIVKSVLHDLNARTVKMGANLRKVSFGMFSIYYSCSCYDVTRTMQDIGSSTRALYISPPTMITNGTKERLPSLLESRHGPKNLGREPKLA